MKKLVKTATVALVTCALAACSGGVEQPDPVPTPTPGTSKTVQVWLIRDGRDHDRRLIRDLQRASSREDRVNVRVEFIPAKQLTDRLQHAKAAGWSPDVVEVPSGQMPSLASDGWLFDMWPAIEDWGIHKDQMIAMERAATMDDHLYGIPFSISAPAMVYNKDIFAQAGITATPKTWDELVQVTERIKQVRPDVEPWPVSAAEANSIYPFLLQDGDELASFDGQAWHSDLASPASVAGLTRYASRVTPQSAQLTNEQLATAIAQGRAAMAVLDSRDVREILRVNPKMDTKLEVFAIPGTNGHVAPVIIEGTHLAIPEGSQAKQYAWHVARRMSTTIFSVNWNQRQGAYPAMKSLLDQTVTNTTNIERPFIRPIVERGMPRPTSPAWPQVEAEQIIPELVAAVAAGRLSAQEAAEQAAGRITTLLNEVR